MTAESFNWKIEAQKQKTGIKTFGYQFGDLKVFSFSELSELNDHGLVDNADINRLEMLRLN